MGCLAILITLLLLDYCVFGLKMRVKTYQKSQEISESQQVLSKNQQKLVLFGHFLIPHWEGSNSCLVTCHSMNEQPIGCLGGLKAERVGHIGDRY